MAAGKAPDGFEVLTETISIHRPETTTSSDETQPPLFVICSWMAAFPRHIQKYTDQYKKLYPSSTILLIQSTWKDVSGTDEFMKPRLAIAISIIQDHLLQRNIPSTTSQGSIPKPKILLHIFSNGGATVANHLSMQLNNSLSSSSSLSTHSQHPQPSSTFSRLILECTPSRPNTSQAVRAVGAAALPSNPLLRLLGNFLIRCFVSYGFWKCWLLGKENMVDKLRRRLNSPFFLLSTRSKPAPTSTSSITEKNENGLTVPKEQIWDAKVPRLYMYSKSDEVVSWQDVRDHAREAREVRGFEDVREEVFEKAPHVGLPREDFERYWGVVEGWWGQR
ncbi:hypothetical protein CKM354_000995500 [Cercospora kikuchii]|uniref:Indole-diterpene biosynthesis protein PaxU n=1 Tax=Cercospora kikuchii TaxID=84275 RepID=A0A9P3FGU3_9PEZI|nr:uncharacterized protein CKM354_000995500 [Cercospora kikuchii]GIZ46846.1 hypothetical protein CKM354_000995500 [Cercospora kikuchii]